MDVLTSLKRFINIVEQQSFIKAALKSSVSVATISKQLLYLENWCGQKLFHRTTRNVKLTPFGEQFYREAQEFIKRAAHLKQLSQQQNVKNEPEIIRLNIPSTFNEGILLPPLFKFMQEHSFLSLHINSKPYLEELTQERADVLITLKKKHSVDVKGIPLLTLSRGIFAAPTYLKKFGIPKKLEDLKMHDCLIFTDKQMPNIWFFPKGKKINVQGKLHADHFNLLINAAIEGLGLLYISEHLVSEQVNKKQLVPILTEFKMIDAELYIYYLRYQYTNGIERLVNYLINYFKKQEISN